MSDAIKEFSLRLERYKYGADLLQKNGRVRAYSVGRSLRRRSRPFSTVFVCGCGRSGTTLLGELLGTLPGGAYLFEPVGRWALVDRRTDVWGRFGPASKTLQLDGADVPVGTEAAYERLFAPSHGSFLVDKSPEHVMRLRYLAHIKDQRRFVIISRSGLDVAASIADLATTNHALGPWGRDNAWWGRNHAKWEAVQLAAAQAGYDGRELAGVRTDLQRGAVEWIVSQRQVEAWMSAPLAPTLPIRYGQLTSEPESVLRKVLAFLEVTADPAWLENSARRVRPGKEHDVQLSLPGRLADDFNRFQEQLGSSGACRRSA